MVRKKAAKKNTRRVSRTPHCITVCGETCVKICFTKNGAVTGEGIPCHICYHGHFCEENKECLSCGTERGFTQAPYRGE